MSTQRSTEPHLVQLLSSWSTVQRRLRQESSRDSTGHSSAFLWADSVDTWRPTTELCARTTNVIGERQILKKCVTGEAFKCPPPPPRTHTQMSHHWKALYIPVTIWPVVELPSGAVSVKQSHHKTINFRN